jgi:hypothetical protein
LPAESLYEKILKEKERKYSGKEAILTRLLMGTH